MIEAPGIRQFDVGVPLGVTFTRDGEPLDISAAITIELYFAKKDKTEVQKTASFATDGMDGKAQYVTEDGFADVAGAWTREGYVELPTGEKLTTELVAFMVHARIQDAPAP